jgi:glutamine synthetase
MVLIVYCKICDIKVNAEKRFTVIQHVKTAKHIQGINRQELKSNKTQQFVSNSLKKKNDFIKDLCKAMLSANIPF